MSFHPLSRVAIATALFAALAQTANADTTLNFDSLTAGSAANSDPAALAAGISFDNAYYGAPVDANGNGIVDGNGDLITTQAWRVDPTVSSPVAVANTQAQGWGTAPSSPNALDATQSAILLHFAAPQDVSGFSFTLPDSTYGTLGSSEVDFLDATGQQLGAIIFTEGTPLALISLGGGPILGVKDVVLASGTYYDNITITAVPVPAALPLMLSSMAGLFAFSRRRKTA